MTCTSAKQTLTKYILVLVFTVAMISGFTSLYAAGGQGAAYPGAKVATIERENTPRSRQGTEGVDDDVPGLSWHRR